MYGAILGDIIGSPYEFDEGMKQKDFPLFSASSGFTDDTVMTVAVAEALLDVGPNAAADAIRSHVVRSMQTWGRRYPDAGYGGRFYGWLLSDDPRPYYSFGNGSAMRVSAAGWLYDTLERTREVARLTAEVTHDHPQGIKGAEAVATAIWLARHGEDRYHIENEIAGRFGYDLNRTCDQIRPRYRFDVTCQGSVPEAITAFLESTGYEDAVRNAVSLGGDSDTQGAIAGSIAEASFGIPAELMIQCRKRLPPDMLTILDRFDKALGRTPR